MTIVVTPNVTGTGDPTSLGALFPTRQPDPERLIYEWLLDASGKAVGGLDPAGNPRGDPLRPGETQEWRLVFPEDNGTPITLPARFATPPDLAFYGDGSDGPSIPLVRGWPAYPGKVPAIGVALGNENEDESNEGIGGFIGDAYAIDNVVSRNIIGTASYYAEPQYATIIVELLHENRDERDRLHVLLRRLLTPLRRKLPLLDPMIWKARVDAEKTEVSGGPPEVEQPFEVYLSLFTIHCWYELWTPENVTGPDGVIEGPWTYQQNYLPPPDPSTVTDPYAYLDLT